jgi:hypothetical protein
MVRGIVSRPSQVGLVAQVSFIAEYSLFPKPPILDPRFR